MTGNRRYLVLLCSERSGSNLLKGMLNESPDVYVCPPMPIYDILHPHVETYGDLDRTERFSDLAEDVARLMAVNHQPLPVVPTGAELVRGVGDRPKSLGSLVLAAMDAEADAKDAAVAGCKYSIHFELLESFLAEAPMSHVLYLTRDPRDVILSKMKGGFETRPFLELADDWAKQQAIAKAFLERRTDLELHRLRYEDVLADPAAALAPVFEWLGARPADPTKFHEQAANKDAAGRSHMWRNLAKPLIAGNHHKYYREWNLADVREIERRCADGMRELGYEPANADRFESDDRTPEPRVLSDEDKAFYRDQDELIQQLAAKAQRRREDAADESAGEERAEVGVVEDAGMAEKPKADESECADSKDAQVTAGGSPSAGPAVEINDSFLQRIKRRMSSLLGSR